ncbi:hypothetical protein [Bradyrhizobium liaoningense]|uniref:hypothetical protein n=1 Tax=Bradyrhizobium liaoningense TaxID=43992 RepID=UPI001BA945FE|nr:hypothetical protein [Bradyrhizobium liaoningense]MBR0817062.1 hypothetical protein [Bradyrhizobium liaoningense]
MQQDVRKNYISIVNDGPGTEQAAGTATRSRPGTVQDLVNRLTAVLKRRLPGAQSPTIAP